MSDKSDKLSTIAIVVSILTMVVNVLGSRWFLECLKNWFG